MLLFPNIFYYRASCLSLLLDVARYDCAQKPNNLLDNKKICLGSNNRFSLILSQNKQPMSIPFNPITISIGKKTLSSFISLQIEQNIGKHHRFQMSVELESGGNRYVHNISENSKKVAG